MRWLFNLTYLALLTLLSPIVVWRMTRRGRYRRGLAQRLLGRLPQPSGHRPRIWFHAVSVGEVVQLAKVVEEFCRATADRFEIVVSVSTDTGFDLATKLMSDRHIVWCPLDLSWAVSAALNRVAPEMLVLMELELWPNLIAECRQRQISVVVINARMSDKSFRGYRRAGRLVRPLFKSLTHVAAQSQHYADRLVELGVRRERVVVTGSIKFDGLEVDRTNHETAGLRKLFGIRPQQIVLMAGSTQPPEEQAIIEIWRRISRRVPSVRLIIVPRHRERFDEVADLIRDSGCALLRRSEFQRGVSDQPELDDDQAVGLLDTIGELGACWGLADVAFVGGSFGSRGGQNMIEPAAYGAAIVFGPNTWNFRDVVAAFHRKQACVQVASLSELATEIQRLVSDSAYRSRIGQAAGRVVRKSRGATRLTVTGLIECLQTRHLVSGAQPTERAA